MKPSLRDMGVFEEYLGFSERLDDNLKRYVVETTTYNFSTSISSNLVNAMAMRFMGSGIFELGLITSIRMLSVTLGSLVAVPLVYRFRAYRLRLWLLFGALNRVGWALSIFTVLLPPPVNLISLLALIALVQVSGAIAGIAATDTLADMIRPSFAGRFLGVLASLNNLVALLALATTLFTFKALDATSAYWVLYLTALCFALISTAALASLKDVRVAEGSASTNPLDLILKYKDVALETPRTKRYIAVTTAFHFAANVPAAFWDYYIMMVLGGDELWITVKNATTLASKVLALRLWSSIIDSVGARRGTIVSIASTSPIPLLYYHSTDLAGVTGISVYSSLAWAPWDISATLYTYYLAPESKRPAFVSLQNITYNAAATLATAVGTWIGAHMGLYYVFATSTILRASIAIISAKLIPELDVKSETPSPSKVP